VRFNENFKDDDRVIFPKLVPGYEPTKYTLVETFCEGVPVLQYARDHSDQQEQLHDMCMTAIKAVCKMIFLDNFVHGTYILPRNFFEVSKYATNVSHFASLCPRGLLTLLL